MLHILRPKFRITKQESQNPLSTLHGLSSKEKKTNLLNTLWRRSHLFAPTPFWFWQYGITVIGEAHIHLERQQVFYLSEVAAQHYVQACISLDFFCFFLFLLSAFVSVIASKRFDCHDLISCNFAFASRKSASDLNAINCWIERQIQ